MEQQTGDKERGRLLYTGEDEEELLEYRLCGQTERSKVQQ